LGRCESALRDLWYDTRVAGFALFPEEVKLLNRKGGSYLLHYQFPIDYWGAQRCEALVKFWESRKFRLKSAENSAVWHGTRGTIWGNLLAFDVRKRLSEVLIEISETDIVCRHLLDFRHQIVTHWDILDHKLELVLFRCALEGKPLPDYFKKLSLSRLPSQIGWTFVGVLTGGIGDRAPNRFHEELIQLADGLLPSMTLRNQGA